MDEIGDINSGVPHNTQAGKRAGFGLKFFVGFLALFLISGSIYWYLNYYDPCGTPIAYRIGNVDDRFGISSQELKSTLDDAANRWNQKFSKTVFEYRDDAELEINLVYDERQQKIDEMKKQIAEFDSATGSIDEFKTKLENMARDYEADLSDYNREVNYWNNLGGAPPAVYNDLNAEKEALDERRLTINRMATILNQQIKLYNDNIDDFNQQIATEKNKIITNGEYFSQDVMINIYTYGDQNELRLVLMHELGHALSREHDNQETSIMYPILGSQNLSDPQLSEEDIEMINSTCSPKTKIHNLLQIINL